MHVVHYVWTHFDGLLSPTKTWLFVDQMTNQVDPRCCRFSCLSFIMHNTSTNKRTQIPIGMEKDAKKSMRALNGLCWDPFVGVDLLFLGMAIAYFWVLLFIYEHWMRNTLCVSSAIFLSRTPMPRLGPALPRDLYCVLCVRDSCFFSLILTTEYSCYSCYSFQFRFTCWLYSFILYNKCRRRLI